MYAMTPIDHKSALYVYRPLSTSVNKRHKKKKSETHVSEVSEIPSGASSVRLTRSHRVAIE